MLPEDWEAAQIFSHYNADVIFMIMSESVLYEAAIKRLRHLRFRLALASLLSCNSRYHLSMVSRLQTRRA
jgi:hypothetical protein